MHSTYKLPNISFKLGGEYFTLTPSDYFSKTFGFELQMSPEPNVIILGDTFLRAYSTVFDYDRKQVGFIKTNPCTPVEDQMVNGSIGNISKELLILPPCDSSKFNVFVQCKGVSTSGYSYDSSSTSEQFTSEQPFESLAENDELPGIIKGKASSSETCLTLDIEVQKFDETFNGESGNCTVHLECVPPQNKPSEGFPWLGAILLVGLFAAIIAVLYLIFTKCSSSSNPPLGSYRPLPEQQDERAIPLLA